MTQMFRLPTSASRLIDRDQLIGFEFNGKHYTGYAGDTLASALLANGVRLVGRSFKYHRPRGFYSAGSEEPNGLFTVGEGALSSPNTRGTVVELHEGLVARSQNHRGSLGFDLMAVNDWFAPLLSAGFYYKTFMWPQAFWEKVYEPSIRASAGLGALSGEPDGSQYDKGYLHCDLLIIGAGPAGLSAALAAGRAGLRVIVADEDFALGGRLLNERYVVDGVSGVQWVQQAVAELESLPNVRILSRTTVIGAFDSGVYGALERAEPEKAAEKAGVKAVLWQVSSQRALLCAGATERGMAFANNDRPGVMLAGAMRAYANRWQVATGKRVAVFTNNDDGWRTAQDLHAAGVEVAAVIDCRETAGQAAPAGVEVIENAQVVDTQGRRQLKGIVLDNGARLAVDALAVSGGWSPNVHLSCHHRGRPTWNSNINGFVPGGELPPGMQVVGAANGELTLAAALQAGYQSANEIAGELAYTPDKAAMPQAEHEPSASSDFFWVRQQPKKRAWLDLQNDVTAKDVVLAQQEGFRAVEHVKRYTTLGMATDQGKTANVPALAVMAAASAKPMSEVGTTIFRPPYTPVPIAAFAGRSRGQHFRPERLTPSHRWAKENGAVFVETGAWLRAQYFVQPGETHWRQSVDREVMQTRAAVGVCDVTTLGKIDIQGRDAGEFLDFVYANRFSTLKVGRVRYGLMLREDGMAYDDGTTARLGEQHFLMTTTTANAVLVFRNLEFVRQCLKPELDVHLISATEQWAQFAVAGPQSRALLQRVIDSEHDISNEAFPFMACGALSVCGGVPARLFRISFSGEMAYEIAVPARYGNSLMGVLMQAGEDLGVVAYGTEALGVMRIEKGHAAGNELNGQTTASDLGLGRMVLSKKDCIGNILSKRTALRDQNRPQLMGFKPVDTAAHFKAGSHFLVKDAALTTENDQGWMSSVAYSPTLDHTIGLGFLANGRARLGEVVRAVDPLRGEETQVEVVSPHFVDPEGERLRG